MAGNTAAKEQELISWDEVKDQKEVYQAVRTPDGRQALVKAGGAQLFKAGNLPVGVTLSMAMPSNIRVHGTIVLILLIDAAEPYARRVGQ